MESITEKFMYDKVADNIRHNIENINKLLENCALHSKVATQGSKIADFLTLDVDNLIEDEPKSDYYDLDQVSKIFDMLRSSKSETKKKGKLAMLERRPSFSSITSLSNLSIEDVTPHGYYTEVKSNLKAICNLLEGISNTSINAPDLNSIANKETSKNSTFVDLLMKLQKLSKELRNIASTDNIVQDEESLNIDDKLINSLSRISEVSRALHCSE